MQTAFFNFCAICLALLLATNQSVAATAKNTQTPTSEANTKTASEQLSPEALFASLLVNAEKGQPKAMLSVGALYEQGIGVQKNFTNALQWYEKAAFAGEPEGYLCVGLCHEIGMGTPADIGKAIENYTKAAEMGSSQSQHKMATLYFAGQGVPKDERKGFQLLQKAAEAGNPAATNELAYIFLKGLAGQKANTAKARTWFAKSAEAGNMEAMKNYAVMLKDGIGAKADPAAALKWYIIASKGGFKAVDLDNIIAGLKQQFTAEQAAKIEKAASDWLAAFAKKQQPSQQ